MRCKSRAAAFEAGSASAAPRLGGQAQDLCWERRQSFSRECGQRYGPQEQIVNLML